MGDKMNKKICIVLNLCLLLWFFLDMVGVSIKGHILVTRSYLEDGVYFLIFLVLLTWFIIKERNGKFLLTGWLFMWFLAQFFSHWYYTLFGPHDGKRSFFAETIKLIPSSEIYVPDLYHIVLQALILISLINMIIYCKKIYRKTSILATRYR